MYGDTDTTDALFLVIIQLVRVFSWAVDFPKDVACRKREYEIDNFLSRF